jgi:hypothetical protein
MLAADLMAVETLAAEGLPKHDFRSAHVLAEMAGVLKGVGSEVHGTTLCAKEQNSNI